jgi:transcriptional regulator with GAF, ATPase, and Fis domain
MAPADDSTWASGRELDAALSSIVRTVVMVASLALEVASLRGRAEPIALTEELDREHAEPIDGVVAESAAMRALLQEVRRFADSEATVLVTGESGVGKEVIARAIHSQSERSSRPFVTFNCQRSAGWAVRRAALRSPQRCFYRRYRESRGRRACRRRRDAVSRRDR